MDDCRRAENEDFHRLMAIAVRLRDELNAFKELYSPNDPKSCEAIAWFDNFKRRIDRRRK